MVLVVFIRAIAGAVLWGLPECGFDDWSRYESRTCVFGKDFSLVKQFPLRSRLRQQRLHD
jgi:hypothetical protein